MEEVRRLSAVENRVETGPVQFGEDWPGLFIRGDNAFAFRLALGTFLVNPNDPIAKMQLRSLAYLMDSCNMLNRREDGGKEGTVAGPDSHS